VEEYKQSEILRSAIQGVKKTAAINEATRISPKKLYSAVRSRVAANIRSQKKANTRAVFAASARKRAGEEQQPDGPYFDNTIKSSPDR
jgi:hypothetical protein